MESNMLPDIFLYGIGALFFAGLAVMAHGSITAPDGYEDERGFHYGRPHNTHARRRRVGVRSRHNANDRRRAHRRKVAA
jgi:hypothetical protein